jgi:hypothetical protein
MNAESRRRWRGERSATTIVTLLVVVAVLSLGVAQACLLRLAFAKSLAQDIQVQLTVEMLPDGQVQITVDAGATAAGYPYVVLRDTEPEGGYFLDLPLAVGPHAQPAYQGELDENGRDQVTIDMSAELVFFQAIVFTEPPLFSNGVQLAPGPVTESPPTPTPTSKPPTVPVTKAPPTATPTATAVPPPPTPTPTSKPPTVPVTVTPTVTPTPTRAPFWVRVVGEGFPWWGWLVPFLGGVGGVMLILRAIKGWQPQPFKEELTQEELGKLIQIEKELPKEVPEKGYPELDKLIQIEELPEEEEKADLPLDVLLHLKWVSNPQAKKKKLQWITWIGDIIDETPDPKPNVPASNLQLEFEIRDRFKDPKLAGLDLKTIKLTADFSFHELKPGTNLYDRKFIKRRGDPKPDKHKFSNMESDNENLVKGWFMLDEPLKPGKHTITLAATDKAGNSKTINLEFAVSGLAPRVQLDVYGAGLELLKFRREDLIKQIPLPPPTFPPSGFAISFEVRDLSSTPERCIGLDPDSIQLTADFDLDGIRVGQNLLPLYRKRGRTKVADEKWEGRLPIEKPLPDGDHTLTLAAADKLGNQNQLELRFTTSREALQPQLVNEHGMILRALRPIPPSQASARKDELHEQLFYIQVIDPTQKVPELSKQVSYEEWKRAADKTLTAKLESLDPNGQRLWGPQEVKLSRAGTYSYCFRSERFVAYEQSKPSPANINKWAIPAIVGGKMRATLKDGSKVERPVAHASLEINKVRARVIDDGTAQSPRMRISVRYAVEGVKPPRHMRMTLSDGGLAQPLEVSARVEKEEVLPGQQTRCDIHFQPHCSPDKFDPEATYTLTLHPKWRRGEEKELPPAEVELPACGIQDIVIKIGNELANLQNLQPVNALADVFTTWSDIRTEVEFKPVGHCDRAETRVTGRAGKETFHKPDPQEYEPLKPGKAEKYLWEPGDIKLLMDERGALVLDVAVEAKADRADSRFVYHLQRVIPIEPRIDRIERQEVTIYDTPKGRITIEDAHKKVAILPGAKAWIEMGTFATSHSGKEYPAAKGVPVTCKLETKGVGGYTFLDAEKRPVGPEVEIETGHKGRVKVYFQVPEAIGGMEEFSLIVHPRHGDIVKFVLVAGKPIVKIDGPEWILCNAQVTYIVETVGEPTRENPVKWAIYDDRDRKVASSEVIGKEIPVMLKELGDYRLVVRFRGDEETREIHAAEVRISRKSGEEELGRTVKYEAVLVPKEAWSVIKPSAAQWSLYWTSSIARRAEPKNWLSQPDDPAKGSPVHLRIMHPGWYILIATLEGVSSEKWQFEVEEMKIEGPKLLTPGVGHQFTIQPSHLDNIEWYICPADQITTGERPPGTRDGMGKKWTWKPRTKDVGKQRDVVAVWDEGNTAMHRVAVATIELDKALGPDRKEMQGQKGDWIPKDCDFTYKAKPSKFEGRTRSYTLEFYRDNELIDRRELGPVRSAMISNWKDQQADRCRIIVEYGHDLRIERTVSLSLEWRGTWPCLWKPIERK